jgi:ketosteroid isomerase-like protein
MSMIEDKMAIQENYSLYAHLLDTQQAHKVPFEVFTEDAEVIYGSGATDKGRAELIERFKTYPNNLEATSHNITNVVAKVHGDTADVIARCIGSHWLLSTKFLGPDRPVDFLMIAAYEDKFRRDADGMWRIAHRKLFSVSPGPLSLAYGTPWPTNLPPLRESGWPA